jgi:hypothetical protein
MLLVVVLVVGAYVLYRKAKQPIQEPVQAQARDQQQKSDGGPDDGPKGDAQGANNKGAEPGRVDPEGLPGKHGPRSVPVCIRTLESACATPREVEISGEIVVADTLVQAGGRSVTALLLTTEPIARWAQKMEANVLAYQFFEGNKINAKVTLCGETQFHLCAVKTTDFSAFGYAHIGGCVAGTFTVDRMPKTVAIEMKQLESTFELIRLSTITPREVWPGTEQRLVKGRIHSEHPDFGGALVAIGTIALVDQPDAVTNPSALALTDKSGNFEAGFLAKPDDPIFLCALGFPKDFSTLAKREKLDGAGCVELKRPKNALTPVIFTNANITLDPKKSYKLTDHERQHYHFLSQCLKP